MITTFISFASAHCTLLIINDLRLFISDHIYPFAHSFDHLSVASYLCPYIRHHILMVYPNCAIGIASRLFPMEQQIQSDTDKFATISENAMYTQLPCTITVSLSSQLIQSDANVPITPIHPHCCPHIT